MKIPIRLLRGFALTAVLVLLASCTSAKPWSEKNPRALNSGDVKMLNYTPWYIHTAEIEGPKESGISGGGPNVMPVKENGRPSGGGGSTCCLSYPAVWQPDLRLTVRWLVFKDVKRLGAKAPGNWYKAENVRIARYDGNHTAGAWLIFLPDDRVRLMVVDGNHDGGNNANNRPPDDDPLIVKGIVDTEWNERFPNGVARGLQ
ncbi:DUF3304 domain-containing protein [Caballeronia novacaledonica]|uniref:DUF3304 domain-containing protein n=1 Tax=Caballeronia novacaledonica TaxID=1544861 RepID=A0AA37INI2_9BURK|nr:DUF3304 domain-containing protein [Caballeronia novacaledonica]GJH29615.1 DUF3304 domain-containing protein [Caballeronia novacaledonica]